jgi:hypothetical protein
MLLEITLYLICSTSTRYRWSINKHTVAMEQIGNRDMEMQQRASHTRTESQSTSSSMARITSKERMVQVLPQSRNRRKQ